MSVFARNTNLSTVPSHAVAGVKGTIARPVGLGRYLDSPGVSTNTTPNVVTTQDLSDVIDGNTHITNIASSMGLVTPTTQKPSAGAATAKISGPGMSKWLLGGLLVALALILWKA